MEDSKVNLPLFANFTKRLASGDKVEPWMILLLLQGPQRVNRWAAVSVLPFQRLDHYTAHRPSAFGEGVVVRSNPSLLVVRLFGCLDYTSLTLLI